MSKVSVLDMLGGEGCSRYEDELYPEIGVEGEPYEHSAFQAGRSMNTKALKTMCVSGEKKQDSKPGEGVGGQVTGPCIGGGEVGKSHMAFIRMAHFTLWTMICLCKVLRGKVTWRSKRITLGAVEGQMDTGRPVMRLLQQSTQR